MWDTEQLEVVRVLEGHNEAVLALAVGDTFLVSGSYDTSVRFWSLDTLRCVRCVLPLSHTTHPRPLTREAGWSVQEASRRCVAHRLAGCVRWHAWLRCRRRRDRVW